MAKAKKEFRKSNVPLKDANQNKKGVRSDTFLFFLTLFLHVESSCVFHPRYLEIPLPLPYHSEALGG